MGSKVSIDKGAVISGKWYGREYSVVSFISEGGTASIFLVDEIPSGARYVMKISRDMINIHSEFNIIKKLKGVHYIPEVYYRDDCIINHIPHYFFIMSYYRGRDLKKIYSAGGLNPKSVLQVIVILCEICSALGEQGVLYCDLKPDNIIFDLDTLSIYLIDFGGTVKEGESINHFTPFFDRASWGVGERVADEGYQIFALSMMLIQLLIGESIGGDRDYEKLLNTVKNSCLSRDLKKVIIKGLGQKYKNLDVFARDLYPLVNRTEIRAEQRKDRMGYVIDLCFIASLVIFCITLVMVTQ